MLRNVVVATETASSALSVQELVPLPVFVADILISRCLPMLVYVGSVMSQSGMVENGPIPDTSTAELTVQD